MKHWWNWQKRSDELEKEIRHHLQMAETERIERGASEYEAQAGARREFGNVGLVKELARDAWGWRWLLDLYEDLRYGMRTLGKSPGFAATAILTLALGIGANTAIFSILDAAILKPLPLKDPSALLIIEWTNSDFPAGVDNINGEFSEIPGGRLRGSSIGANLYRKLAREQTDFASVIGIADPDSVAVALDASPAEEVSLQYVSGNFFQGLEAWPRIGRPFRDEEDRVGQEPVVIVSHRFWMERLGGAGDALNRIVRINNAPARIVGVAPPEFFGLRAGQWTDVYAPLGTRARFQPGGSNGAAQGEDDRDWWVRPAGRLKPGTPESLAKMHIASLFSKLAAQEMDLEPSKIPELITLPGGRGFHALNTEAARALWILMLLVGVLLLIVCANLANLVLSRSVVRRRESAVRLALGATRARIFRQHLVESGLLGFLGGAGGLALGYILAQAIRLLFQSGRDPSSKFDLPLDLRVFGCAAFLSILTSLLFGAMPAVQAAHAQLSEALKSHARSVVGGRLRLPRALVSVQIALCLTALVAAGLLGRSLENLKWADVGFDRENLAYASINPGQAGYSAEQMGAYVDRVREEIGRLPGVVSVSTVGFRLLSSGGQLSRVSIPGHPSLTEKGMVTPAQAATENWIGEGFFETLHIPLVAGRTIDRRDIHPDGEAVVVDELFARDFFPNENPIGRRFGFDPKENTRYEIAGIVRSTRYNSLRDEPVPAVYEPYARESRGPVHFAIRTTIDSGSLAQAVRAGIASVDPAVPMTEFHTQNELIDGLLRTERLLALLSGAFGVVALTLAAVGIGGVLAYAVARRTNEIGVRMALGAATTDVMRMVLRDSLWMAGTGILIGLPCAYAIGKILRATLFRLEPLDPWTAALSFLTLMAVALLAAWLPARRAMRVDPVVALRYE